MVAKTRRPHSDYHGCNVVNDGSDPTMIPGKHRSAIVPEVRRGLRRAGKPGAGVGNLDGWHRHHIEQCSRGSSYINRWLGRNSMYRRGFDPIAPRWAGAAIRCLVEAVQHMYCGKLNRVWRGLALTKDQITEYRKNSMIQWQAFTSTSLSEREAEQFARGGAHELKHPVLFEIRRDPKRATAARIDDLVAEDYASEKEVLMIPGCRFEVGGVTTDGDLTRITLFERENAYEEMGWM